MKRHIDGAHMVVWRRCRNVDFFFNLLARCEISRNRIIFFFFFFFRWIAIWNVPSNFGASEQVSLLTGFEKEREKEWGVRPPPECALRQVTALLSPAPLLEDGMYGVGCLEGRWGWKRKGVVRQALQTLCSEETAEKPQHISRLEKKGVCSSSGEQRTALFVSRTHSPRCPRQKPRLNAWLYYSRKS